MTGNRSTGPIIPSLGNGGRGILEKEKPKENRECGGQELGAGQAGEPGGSRLAEGQGEAGAQDSVMALLCQHLLSGRQRCNPQGVTAV